MNGFVELGYDPDVTIRTPADADRLAVETRQRETARIARILTSGAGESLDRERGSEAAMHAHGDSLCWSGYFDGHRYVPAHPVEASEPLVDRRSHEHQVRDLVYAMEQAEDDLITHITGVAMAEAA